MTQLKQGKIPAHTECPFGEDCPIRAKGACRHLGIGHITEFSCAAARAFDMRPSNVEIVVKESFVRACWPEAWRAWELDNNEVPAQNPMFVVRFAVRSTETDNILTVKGILGANCVEWKWVPAKKEWHITI